MAEGDPIGENKEVVRYARPSDVREGVLSGTAFERPEKDKDGLSVCCLGVFENDPDADLSEVWRVLGLWRDLRPNGRLAQISVCDIIAVGVEVNEALLVTEDPLPDAEGKPANPAHALINGLPFRGASEGELGGVLASDLLARKVSQLHAVT